MKSLPWMFQFLSKSFRSSVDQYELSETNRRWIFFTIRRKILIYWLVYKTLKTIFSQRFTKKNKSGTLQLALSVRLEIDKDGSITKILEKTRIGTFSQKKIEFTWSRTSMYRIEPCYSTLYTTRTISSTGHFKLFVKFFWKTLDLLSVK